MVVDTSDLNVHQLAERVVKSFNISGGDTMRMTLMTFGFKNGVPFDADVNYERSEPVVVACGYPAVVAAVACECCASMPSERAMV